MKIKEFVSQFNTIKELKDCLTTQSKDFLYSVYMEDTDYRGLSYRHITRNKLKDIFLDVYVTYTVSRLDKNRNLCCDYK